MAFLIDIGTGLVGKLVDYTVVFVGRQVGYLIYHNQNVKSLEDQLDNLDAASQSVKERVVAEKRNIREVEAPVNKWLADVEKITQEAKEILNEERVKKKWLCGLCPNLVVRHKLSRRSTKSVSDIVELCGKKEFTTFAHATIPKDVPSKDYEAFDSRTSVVNQIMDVLRNSHDIDMIGVYGIGGVGKTTLVKEVARQATGDESLFDDVALILDVKQNPSIQRIQKEIAEKLGLELPETESIAGRARRVFGRIEKQKTLVILDDVWERIDVEAVGLSGVANCKVLLTSRSREVLSGEMHTRKEFPLDLLGEEETWNLFEKKAGDVIKDPSIKTVAIKVAKRCGGLPVLVVTVASALKNRSSLHTWKDALTGLKRFDGKDLTEKSYLALEWSYNQLNGEELKQMFLLCGFYMDSPKIIHIDYLFKYGIGLGLFKNQNTMAEAWHRLNSSLEKLKDSCLLLDHEKSGCVKMHDLVYDVAERILLRDQHVWKVCVGDHFIEWPDTKDFHEKCSMISIVESTIKTKLPDVLRCTQLKLFLLQGNDTEITCDFFKETTELGVLDLTSLTIPSLPSSLQFLKSLKTLCPEWCTLGDIALIGQLQDLELLSFRGSNFEELPKDIGQLTRLRLLDLTGCSQLQLISPGVISNLERLEELRMGNSFNRWEAEGVMSTEKINASLSELKHLSKLSTLYIHILDASILPSNVFSNSLERFQIYIGDTWKWDDQDRDLNTVKINLTNGNDLYQSGLNKLLKTTDELHLDGPPVTNNITYEVDGEAFQQLKHLHVRSAEFRHIINGKGVSTNLKKLVVGDLKDSRFLLSSSGAKSLVQLTHLEVFKCQTMEEIVSINGYDEKHMKDMFSKLQYLELRDLPILTRFCSISYTGNSSLEILELENDNEIEERDFTEEHSQVLFDEKIVFPSLKTLFINGLTKIKTIWQNQLSPESFRNIETLNIKWCKSLKSVFPFSIVTSLGQLMNLEVIYCGVEEIIANEDGVEGTQDFVFPKVKSLTFAGLAQLRCFYPGMHVSWWPSLEDMSVKHAMSFLAQEYSERNCELTNCTPKNQALFSIKKDSFPNLKEVGLEGGMEIWDGPFPVNFFSKLERFLVRNQDSESATILEKFEKLGEMNSAPSNEISYHEKRSSEDINAVGALTHLTQLWLWGMSKLMHLGEDNSQIPSQNFPNLKVLGITNCANLRNLRSSAISFKNLKELHVSDCSGLEYLLNYSTAKSLMQLRLLSVKDCSRLVEIVESTEDNDDSGNEIVFSRLTGLELSNLPKLRGFCSRDHCIVKFPLLETLSISKRLKLMIFHYNETLLVTNEEDDTDVDSDAGDTDVDSDAGETVVQVAKENVDIDTGDDGEQIDEITHITNGKKDQNCDRSEHVQAVEITSTDQGVIATEEENRIPVGEVTTPVFPVIVSPPFAEVAGEQAFSGQNLEPLAEETRQEQSDLFEPIIRTLAPPKSFEATRSLSVKFQALSAEKVDIVQTGASCEEIGETTHVINKNTDENFDGPEHVQPHKNITPNDQRVVAEENQAIAPVGEITTPVISITEPPLVAEVPHVGEVGEQAFSGPAEEARPNEHETPKAPDMLVEEHIGPFEPSAAAIHNSTPSLAPSSSPKLSEAKQSLREKLQVLSAKKAASSSCMPDKAKAELKALIATANLKDPNARQQLLAVLPTLPLSPTKWIADLVALELSKLPLVLDQEELLCHELASLKAQGTELDERSHLFLSEGSAAEESIQKVQEQKAQLQALEEKIKKLEAQATSLRDELSIGEKRYSGFEASLDQLFEEQQLHNLSVDSTSQELLRTRAVSDSLCTAIFTHLRQLL